MTKEEILKSKLPQEFRHGWFGSNPVIEWEKALEAMQEYADSEVKKICLGTISGQSEQLCQTFLPDGKTTSASKCQFCGKEKWEH